MTEHRSDQMPDDWSDDRLAAAFVARASSTPSTPINLVADVTAMSGRRRGTLLGWAPIPAMALVLILSAVLAGQYIGQPMASPPDGSPRASVPSAESSASAPLLEALGEPMSVADAVAIRDGSRNDDREILVEGFLAAVPIIYCPLQLGPGNPALLDCPENWQWLVPNGAPLETHPPTGPAIHASFALVEPPATPRDLELPSVPVELIGHFHDRRASLCDAADVCAETFVVDRVVTVDDAEWPVQTTFHGEGRRIDLERDLDALVGTAAPRAVVASRQVVTVADAYNIEPLLREDPTVGNWGDKASLIWLVTAIDVVPGGPSARTFALMDGSDWFAEITANGTRYLDRNAVPPGSAVPPLLPTGDPAAFASAPTSVLGIEVRGLGSIQAQRASTMDQLGRDELAVRGWYIAPKPGVTCSEPPPAIHAPTPPCDEARHWLLDDPKQFGVEQGQMRRNPAADLWPPVINPLLPIDVTFDPGATWQGGTPSPLPVIVLGHFEDNRVDTYAGNVFCVIDALAWVAGRSIPVTDSVVRLTPNATEDSTSVLGRIDQVAPDDAVITWATVVDAADFAAIDGRAVSMPEFEAGAPIWMIRRLIHGEQDGRERLAIQWVWTADGGQRIWWTVCPDCWIDLATTLDLQDLDANTALVRVFDYDDVVTFVGPATGLSGLDWQQPHGNATDDLDVARGRTDREVVIRWISPSCPGIT